MRRFISAGVIGIVCFGLGAAVQRYYDMHRWTTPLLVKTVTLPNPNEPAAIQFDKEPLWAYGFDKAPAPGEKASPQPPPNRNLRKNEDPVEQTRLRRLQGSSNTYSLVDIRDGQNVIDWFPGDHPPMPNVVAHGPDSMGKSTRGCGSCHLPNGKGRPENAGIAGLPIPYFLRQIDDFKNGRRHTADPRKPNTNTMIELAKSLSESELKEAAEYFSSMKWTPWIRVVETDLVPKTRIVGNLFLPLEAAKTESIAGRIIEMPENEEQSETYRNPHSGFIAYVPPGSVAKGKALVEGGGGKTLACPICHGEGLKGLGDVPRLAGVHPIYIVRQLYNFQIGANASTAGAQMKKVVEKLTEDDMIAIAAYTASLVP